jgi:hypothetical protein
MPSNLDTIPSSSRPPTNRSAATLQSDIKDRETLKAALGREDKSNIPREISGAISTFVSQNLQRFKLLPEPKVGRTSQYNPTFREAHRRLAQFEREYTEASQVAGSLLETSQSLLELDHAATQDEDGNNDKDTENAKRYRDLVTKQFEQLFTLDSKFPGGLSRAPECLTQIMEMDPREQARHLQAVSLCKILHSHDFARREREN